MKTRLQQQLYTEMLQSLEQQPINTWFDLGLYLDTLRDQLNPFQLPKKFDDYLAETNKGIAFISFDFGIDGVTMEVTKYALALEKLLASRSSRKTPHVPPLHFIAGTFKKSHENLLKSRWHKHTIADIAGFNSWHGYRTFFNTPLSRGSDEYNQLITELWQQTKSICQAIGALIVDHNIQLLFPCNVNSNPGNVALALALAIISEKLKIPVLNNNHDFYWEDGKCSQLRAKDEPTGVRDHFFTNAGIGEVFTLIELLYPWDRPHWFQTVLSSTQHNELIKAYGLNPGTIGLMPTSVDTKTYRLINEQERLHILLRMQTLLAGDNNPLVSKNVDDYMDVDADWIEHASPLLLGLRNDLPHSLLSANLLLLQPTRIIARKCIQRNFAFIKELLQHLPFSRAFNEYDDLRITLYITGPVAFPFSEHSDYFNELTKAFKTFLLALPKHYQQRVFIAFNFGAEKNAAFQARSYKRLKIHEIYAVANLVLLPSKQEGRGLPLLESASAGVPILTSRYHPEKVFCEVIGEHLKKDLRLHVLEFPADDRFTPQQLDTITHLFMDPYGQNHNHNRKVINKRYSHKVLTHTLEDFLYKLWFNCRWHKKLFKPIKKVFKRYHQQSNFSKQFNEVVLCKNRKYLPGISDIEYMSYLKSLIDPSYFRMEEKEVKGRIMDHARYLIDNFIQRTASKKAILAFYRKLTMIFYYTEGKDSLAFDHSLSYRHRNRKHYPYRKMTELELCGVIGLLLDDCIKATIEPKIQGRGHNVFQDIVGGIHECAGAPNIVIDNSSLLARDLKSHKPVAWFPGPNLALECLIFVWRTLRTRLGIGFGERLNDSTLKNFTPEIGTVSAFIRTTSDGYRLTVKTVRHWIEHRAPSEIRAFYHAGFFRIIPTEHVSRGIHLGQIGKQALTELVNIKANNGFVVAVGESAALSLDLLDIPSYRIGQVHSKIGASFLGLNIDDGYIQWVPAGLRPSLTYPTPTQTPVDFSKAIGSDIMQECVTKIGKEQVIKLLREDADSFGTPISKVLQTIKQTHFKEINVTAASPVVANLITGLHPDDSPWSGAIARIRKQHLSKDKRNFFTVFSEQPNDTVLVLAERFFNKTGMQAQVAWNGGYILNPELVGKLGLPEKYIGSPLGLLIEDGKIISPPLFNKPALVFAKGGQVLIRDANLQQGFRVKDATGTITEFAATGYNNPAKSNNTFYLDLMFAKSKIAAENRVFFHLSGNTIIKVIKDRKDEVDVNPVGLTLAFDHANYPTNWAEGSTLEFTLPGWDDTISAIEAGPQLVRDGKEAVEMDTGGWKTQKSIATQAARVDFTDMRGPKIGVGVSADGDMMIVAINGRIRESVGATHVELANIFLQQGAQQAMGFDPGGSVTLVVDGTQLNITPYNKDYEKNPLSLPPQPRFVGNAIVGHFMG